MSQMKIWNKLKGVARLAFRQSKASRKVSMVNECRVPVNYKSHHIYNKLSEERGQLAE
jgi:hypothetical protein